MHFIRHRIAAALISCVAATSAAAVPVQWLPSAGGNGHFYEAVVVPSGVTWTEAMNAAIAKGGYLVTITSAAENSFVFSLINNPVYWKSYTINTFGPWIGGFQPFGSPEPAGGWQWVNGEGSFAYSNWFPGSPNNGAGGFGQQDKAIFYAGAINSTAATWDDYNDANPSLVISYVIESAVPEPTPVALLLIGLLGLAFARRTMQT